MVFDSIKKKFSSTDEKYEVLYYKYSQIKVENQRLKEKHTKEMNEYKERLQKKFAKEIISVFEDLENTKSQSFKVKATDKEIQRLLINLNTTEKNMKKVMVAHSIEEVEAKERFYDPELHEVASYQDSKGMKKGIVIKTVKKGFKYKNQVIKKPMVVVTK